MPKIATPLNDKRIKAMKPKAKRYLISDGGGLSLEVMTSGAKIWRFRYSLHGKQQPMATIGEYPAIGLQDARTYHSRCAGRGRRIGKMVLGMVPRCEAKLELI